MHECHSFQSGMCGGFNLMYTETASESPWHIYHASILVPNFAKLCYPSLTILAIHACRSFRDGPCTYTIRTILVSQITLFEVTIMWLMIALVSNTENTKGEDFHTFVSSLS